MIVLLYEMKLLLPNLKISGFDISKHGLMSAKEIINKDLWEIIQKYKEYCYTNINNIKIIISIIIISIIIIS